MTAHWQDWPACRATLPLLVVAVSLGGPPLLAPNLAAQVLASQPGLASSQAAPAPEIPPEDLGRVEGSVRSITGEVIPRATVRVQGPGSLENPVPVNYAATSDDEGNFVVENLPPGDRYRITAERPGFVTAAFGSRNNPAGTPVKIGRGQTLRNIAIVLTPQGVISGRITDRNGDPLLRVRVSAAEYRYLFFGRSLVTRASATTDDLGEYRISGLPPGDYYLQAVPLNSAVTASAGPSIEEANITTYYPNGADSASAARIHVTAGSELRGADIRMLTGKVYSVSGSVSPPPAGTLLISAGQFGVFQGSDLLASLANLQQVQPDGSFQFRSLTPGGYRLMTRSRNRPGAPTVPDTFGYLDITIDDTDLSGLVIPLGPGAIISGSITMAEGDLAAAFASSTPAGAAPAATQNPFGRMPLSFEAAQPAGSAIGTGGLALFQADGTFQTQGMPPGRYRVNLMGLPPGIYLKSAVFGGSDVTHGELDLPSGSGGTLNIVLSDKAADITGVIPKGIENGDEPPILGGVPVALWPKTQDLERIRREVKLVVTDQSGAFNFQSLPPGDFYLAAFDASDQGLPRVPEFLVQFNSRAEELEIEEGAHLARQLEVIEATAVTAAEEKLP